MREMDQGTIMERTIMDESQIKKKGLIPAEDFQNPYIMPRKDEFAEAT